MRFQRVFFFSLFVDSGNRVFVPSWYRVHNIKFGQPKVDSSGWLRWAWWLGPKGGRVEGRRTSRAVTAASRVCGLVGTRAGQHGPTNLGRARGHHAVGVLWALTSPRRHPRRLPELSRVCDPSRPCTYACAGSRRASAVCAPLPGARASPAACVDGCSGRTDEAADCPWHLPRR